MARGTIVKHILLTILAVAWLGHATLGRCVAAEDFLFAPVSNVTFVDQMSADEAAAYRAYWQQEAPTQFRLVDA